LEKQKSGRIYGVLAVGFATFFLLPLLWYGWGEDQGLYAYGAWIWRKWGQAPYAHCFDQNFPGIFLIHYFIQTVFGESVTAFRVFDLLWQAGTVVMVYLVSARLFQNRISGLLSSVFYAIAYVDLGAWNTGQRDGFLLLLYLLSFWRLTKNNNLVSALVAGLLIGLAFIIKPVAALMGLVFLGMIYKDSKSKFLSMLLFVIAGALPFLAVVLYYLGIGELNSLYQALVLFSLKIFSGSLVFSLSGMLAGIFMKNYLLNNSLVIIGTVLYLIFRYKLTELRREESSWLPLMLLAGYMGYLAQSKYFFYQQAPVWGVLCLLAGGGWGMAFAVYKETSEVKVRQRDFFIITVLILAHVLLIKPYIREQLEKSLPLSLADGQKRYPFYDICLQTARYVEERSGDNDTVQVWGGEAIVNYLAQRRAPSRFPCTLHLIFKPATKKISPFQRELAQELFVSVSKSPPLYFVVELLPHPGFGIDSEKSVLVRDYPELWDFVVKNYALENKIGFMEIYRRKQ
jgi:hypothetical protein